MGSRTDDPSEHDKPVPSELFAPPAPPSLTEWAARIREEDPALDTEVFTLITVPPAPGMNPVFQTFVPSDLPPGVTPSDIAMTRVAGWVHWGKSGEVLLLLRGNLTSLQDAITQTY